jgi:hypothetical protein
MGILPRNVLGDFMGNDTKGGSSCDTDAMRQLPAGNVTLEGAQQFLTSLFRGEETRRLLIPYFGTEFFDILKLAPGEYAILSLLGHFAIVLPVEYIGSLRSTKPVSQEEWRNITNQIMGMYDEVYHALVPSLASVNHNDCEFKGLKCTSWHGLVGQYVPKATKAIETGIVLASAKMKSGEFGPFIRKYFARLQRESGRRHDKKTVYAIALRAMQAYEAKSALKGEGLDATDPDLRSFIRRLQQELPRAWAFKYGTKTDFLKLEDAMIELMESCVIPGRAVGPRNAFFRKCKREGLGHVRISKKWNGMSIDERRNIAPLAPGNLSPSAVKKALERDKRSNGDNP